MRNSLTLLAALFSIVACGDDDGSGGGVDAGDSGDADVVDGGPQVTSCGVLLTFPNAAQRAGAQVLFSLPDGTIYGSAVTDVDGRAVRDDCQPGTLITFDLSTTAGGFEGSLSSIDAYTIAGVVPGDTIVFPAQSSDQLAGIASVNVPSTGGIPATRFLVSTGCAGAGASSIGLPIIGQGLGVSDSCLGGDQTADVVAYLTNDDELTGFTSQIGVAVSNGETVEVDLPAFTNVSADADLTVTITNPPAGTELEAGTYQGRDQVSFYSNDSEVVFDGTSGTATLDLLPSSFADFVDTYVEASTDSFPGSYTLVRTRGAPTTTAAFDMSSALPLVRGAEFSFADGNLTFSWQADGSFAEADHGTARITFNDRLVSGSWRVIFPVGEGSSFTLSQLPKALGVDQIPNVQLQSFGFVEYDWTDYQGAITGGLRFGLRVVDTTTIARTQRESIFSYGK
ncbi:MAG: hypothetical protein KJO07_00070 [Deltaproteobacteria bacterium]|nr:hypothetical protein [Deltaproteobacteria bacterium]